MSNYLWILFSVWALSGLAFWSFVAASARSSDLESHEPAQSPRLSQWAFGLSRRSVME